MLTSSDDDDDDETPSTGVLTAWFLVCEWAADDGDHWLTYHMDNQQPVWLSRGMLSEAISDMTK